MTDGPVTTILKRIEETQAKGYAAIEDQMRKAWVFMILGFALTMVNLMLLLFAA